MSRMELTWNMQKEWTVFPGHNITDWELLLSSATVPAELSDHWVFSWSAYTTPGHLAQENVCLHGGTCLRIALEASHILITHVVPHFQVLTYKLILPDISYAFFSFEGRGGVWQGEKRFIWLTFSESQSTEESWGRNSNWVEIWSQEDTEAVEECGLLVCSLWIAQPAFLYIPGPPALEVQPTMGWTLLHQSHKKMLSRRH